MAAIALAALMALAAGAALPRAAYAASPDPSIGESTGHFEWSDEEQAYLVYDVGGWKQFAAQSRTHNFEGITVKLTEDLDFSDAIDIEEDGRTNYTIGVNNDPEFAFHGIFDGQNHTVSNISNRREGIIAVADCGLFSYTLNAKISNLKIEDSYVGASRRGGVLVGLAEYTLIENVAITNSTISVVPGNNVVNLITNAGMSGGMLAGEINCSTVYNCEVKDGDAICNATGAVGALGGQPLYLGAMVGYATDSVIEYSRVTASTDDAGAIVQDGRTSVRMHYDTAVGAVSASELFTGGLVGGVCSTGGTGSEGGGTYDVNSRIVDCFSTATIDSYAACYVSVGAGTAGYVGGIVGRVGASVGGTMDVYLDRCSFAGSMTSYQYNALLVIPIIEKNKFLAGVVGRGGDDAVVADCYYNASLNTEAGAGKVVAIQGGTLDSDAQADGANFGPRDSRYAERSFWEGCGFDFAGGTDRDEAIGDAHYYPYNSTVGEVRPSFALNAGEHVNKWVMDYHNSMPVHGSSIAATLDFPGAGTAAIGATGLSPDGMAKTDDPYAFASQGFLPSDASVTVTYEAAQNPAQGDAANQGWKLVGWYRQPDVTVTAIPANHRLFTQTNDYLGEGPIIGNEGKLVGEDTVLTLENNAEEQQNEYLNDDLFVAYTQAHVLLHDVRGAVLDAAGAPDADVSDDWHDFGDGIALPSRVASDADAVSGTATLIGWTTRPSQNGGAGYAAIGSTELAQLKADGVFWEVGADFTVEAPANLYPVYSDYVTNVQAVFEGYENDDPADPSNRDGYGSVSVGQDDAGAYVKMTPEAAGQVESGAAAFIGWYASDAATGEEVRVSADEQYYLSADELLEQRTYTARFEYRVQYYTQADGDLWATQWVRYEGVFDDLGGLDASDDGLSGDHHDFIEWHLGMNHTVATGENGLVDSQVTDVWVVKYPMDVHAHWDSDDGVADMKMVFATDFPGAAEMEYSVGSGGWITKKVKASAVQNDGYRLYGWTSDGDEGDGAWHKVYDDIQGNPPVASWEEGHWTGSDHYWHEVHSSAYVTFHHPENDAVVERVYRENVFKASDETHAVEYHFDVNKAEPTGMSVTSAASPADANMARDGYVFLGWIVADELSDSEFDYVFNGADLGNGVKAADASRAMPYVADEETLVCDRPMDLYPVYAAFDVETTTNIAAAGVDGSVYNIPGDPGIADGGIDPAAGTVSLSYNNDGGTLASGAVSPASIAYDAEGRASIVLSADKDVKVFKDGSSEEAYEFVSLTVAENGQKRTLAADSDGTYPFVIEAGHAYEFSANYSPVPVQVVYHLGGDGSQANPETDTFSCEAGDVLPSTKYRPAFENEGFFVGWAEGAADGAPIAWGEGVKIANPGKDTVEHAMHLWPVYRAGAVTVDSNIDDAVGTGHRGAEKRGDDLWLVAKDVEGYQFVEWATGYSADDPDAAQAVSSGKEYRLSGDARFDGARYTAVYEKVNEVRYHDTSGNVIYAAKVPVSDDRSFYETVQDSEGGSVEAIIDAEAFAAINAHVAAKDAESADWRERFVTWQWVQADGAAERWSADAGNFTHEPVASNAVDGAMDLYPITMKLAAREAYGDRPYCTDGLTWAISAGEDGKTEVKTQFIGDYAQNCLYVDASEVAYAPSEGGATAGREKAATGVPVSLYMKDGWLYGTKSTAKSTDQSYATAIFDFDGVLEIVKRTKDASAAGRTFRFTVEGLSDANIHYQKPMTMSVPVTLSEEPDAQGYYTGTVRFAVAYGEYTVSEDAGMAWKYEPAWSDDADTDKDGVQVVVMYRGVGDDGAPRASSITVENERRDDADAWLEDDYRVTNVFKDNDFATEHDEPGKGCE